MLRAILALAAGIVCGALAFAWLRIEREARVCPPYYECNGKPETRHPACCPEI